MRVPMGRRISACELHGASKVLECRMKICATHQGGSEREMGIGRGGTRRMADLVREPKGLPCKPFRTLDISVAELYEREICKGEDSCRSMACAGERPASTCACPRGTSPAYRHSLPSGWGSSTNLAACAASVMPRLR